MDEKEKLLELMRCPEQDRSYEWCVELAQALGYGIGGEPGAVWIDKPREPVYSLWFSLGALIEDLLDDARQYVVCHGLP